MRFGAPLSLSVLGHVAVAVIGLAATPYIDQRYIPPAIIPVDFVVGDVPQWSGPPPSAEPAPETPSGKPPRPTPPEPEPEPDEEEPEPVPLPEASDAATTTEDAPLEAEDAPVAPAPEETPQETPPAPAPEPEPEPEPAPPEEEPEEATPEPEDLGPPPPPRVKPPPPRQRRLDSLRDLLESREASSQARNPNTAPPQGALSRTSGSEGQAVVAFKTAVQAKLQGCWRTSLDAPNPEALLVVVELEFERDGRLAQAPEVKNAAQIALSGNPFWAAAQRRAVAGVVECDRRGEYPPPPEPFEENRRVLVNFRPQFGG